MSSRKKLHTMIFGLLVVMFSTIGCAVFNTLPIVATATPYPTYMPYPTYTPYPTFTPPPPTVTPVPEHWSVKVMSAIKAPTFGDWLYPEDQNAEFVIITIEYTYMGQDTTEFSPQSLVLLFPDGSSHPGAAFTATNYQSDGATTVKNLTTESSLILTYIRPGQTKIESFGWGLISTGDTKYRLLFPETKPIDIVVDNP